MYNSFRNYCERLLRIPPEPEAPPGDEGSTRVFRAAPNFYKYLLVAWALKTLAALAAVVFIEIAPGVAAIVEGRQGERWPWLVVPLLIAVAGLVIAARLISLAILRLDFEKRWYVVTDRSLRVREGVFRVSEMTITFANIQNISVSQGPLQRLLNISDLRVDTAGGGSSGGHGKEGSHNLHTAWFRGIDNAHEVRELIQRRLRQLRDAGLGDQDDSEKASPARAVSDVTAVLREVLTEATALRRAAEGKSAQTVG